MSQEIHAQRTPSGWLWCLHCSRTYRYGEYRPQDNLQMCPYEECDGDTYCDGLSYDEIREETCPSWPEVPVKGEFYEM